MATTANDRWFDGAQWIVIGQLPATLVVPSAPTNLAVSPLQTQITVTCTIPASNGGTAITGYTWTITPAGGATSTVTTGASTLTKTWTGLASSTTFTITVAATNSVGTGPAASTTAQTQAASTSTVTYGPDGSTYPSLTPAINATVYATIALNDIAGLIAALRTVPSGQVIMLSNGTWNQATISDSTARTHLLTLAQNVLIRPVTWGAATIKMTVSVPCTSWMGFNLTSHSFSGYPTSSANANRSRIARCKLLGPLNISSVDDLELYEIVAPTRGLDYDRLQINTQNLATSAQARVASNYKIDRCWFEGCDATVGTALHVDNGQLLIQAGTNVVQNSYWGGGGNSSSLSISADEQYSWAGGTTSILNNYVLPTTPQGNGFEMKGTGSYTLIVRGNELESAVWHIPGDNVANATVDTNKFAAATLKASSGGATYNAQFPSNTYGATLTRPTFVNPPWWW